MAEGREGVFDRRHRALTVGAVLTVSVVAFEALALATVAPRIARDLGGVELYGWIFSAFLLAQIVGAVAAGQEADRVGVTRPFLISLALLGFGLLVGALAPGMMTLISGRVLQGLGGGGLVTCVYALINTGYPDHLRTPMLAAFSSAFILPALIGPAIAGFIAEQFTWRAVFYGLLPFLIAVGLLTATSFGSLSPARRESADEGPARSRLPSAVMLAVGTGLLLTGLYIAAGEHLSLFGLEMRPLVVGPLVTGLGILATIPALRAVLPDGTLVARKGLPATVAAKGLLAAGFFYTETYLVLTLNEVSGYTATTAGLVVSAGSLSSTAGTWTQETMDKREEGRKRRSRVLVGAALLAVCISTLAAVVVAFGELPLSIALASWVTAGLGMGLANTASLSVAFAHAPAGEEGAVSSSVLISDLFLPATTIGIGGTLVALGAAREGGMQTGIVLAFGLSFLLATLLLTSAFRLPKDAAEDVEL